MIRKQSNARACVVVEKRMQGSCHREAPMKREGLDVLKRNL